MDKKHGYNKIKEISEAVNEGGSRLEGIINKTALSLEEELNFAFPIDGSTQATLTHIHNQLDIGTRITTLDANIGTIITPDPRSLRGQKEVQEREMITAETEMNRHTTGRTITNTTLYNQAKARYDVAKQQLDEIEQKIVNAQNEIRSLSAFDVGGQHAGHIPNRISEIEAIIDAHDIFNTANTITHSSLDIGASAVAPYPYNLDNLFDGGTPGAKNYMLYDEKQKKRFRLGNPIRVSAKTMGGADVQVTLKGININGTPPMLSINNLEVEGDVSDDPLQIRDLNVRGIYQDALGRSFYHDKRISLTINNPILARNQARRNAEIDAYNGAGVNPGSITRSLDARYRNEGLKMQKQAVFDALKKLDGPKFDKLNESQKDEFFNTIYARYSDHRTSPSVTFPGLPPTPWITYIQGINNYAGMRDWMSADDHESNTPEHTKNAESYRNYVHNNLEDQTGKYIGAQLNRLFSDDLETNMYLKSELSDFLTGLENRKRDDNTHSDIDAGLQEDAMENTRGGAGIFSRRLGRRDVNYGRFFAGKASKKIDATVTLDTEREGLERNKKYPNPLTYGLQTSSSGDSIKATITMPGLGELTLKGREPNAIVREILRRTDIPFGKLRCHIAYSFLKSMVQMAKDSHISLNYTDPGTGNKRRIIIDDQNKLIIEEYDDHTNHSHAGAWRRIETNHFNEDMFDNNQLRDSATDNRSLRRGIEGLTTEFSCAMNQYHRHYRTATERRRWGLKKGEMRTTLPSNFFLSPIKSIRKWFGSKMDFPFSTSVSGGGKSANIEFTGKQFKVTIGDKTYTNNNLGTILNEREGKKRVFDGIEREICAAVYKQLVDKIRENRRVGNKHFGVVDPMTKGVYMIDTDGEWSYIEPENANQANIQRSQFMERAVGAGIGAAAGAGAGVGTVAMMGGSLFKGGLIGSALGSIGGGLLGGMDSRNSYGEIPHPPMRRRMLSESEKEELFHNPLLMARVIRGMSDGLR